MTELEIARNEHRQAERSVRRLAQECRTRRYTWLDRRLGQERKRLEAATERLARLEAGATQPADAGSRQQPPQPTPQQPHTQRTGS